MNALRERWQSTFKLVASQIDLSPCNGCDECGLRCTSGVPMTQSEFEAVSEFRSANLELVRAAEGQPKQVDFGDGVTISACRFRNRGLGRCSIYPVRPLVCRLLGHVEWLPCPIGKIDRIAETESALSLMAEYAMLDRKTYEEWDSQLNTHPTK